MTTTLTLPGTANDISLIMPADLPYEEWEQVGQQLCGAKESIKWWIGDWINYGQHVYGEKYAQALDVTGLDYQTLQNIAWTCRKIGIPQRRSKLSFAHHFEVTALPPSEQENLLLMAEQEGLTSKALREQVRAYRQQEDPTQQTFQVDVAYLDTVVVKVTAENKEKAQDAAFAAFKKALKKEDLEYKWLN